MTRDDVEKLTEWKKAYDIFPSVSGDMAFKKILTNFGNEESVDGVKILPDPGPRPNKPHNLIYGQTQEPSPAYLNEHRKLWEEAVKTQQELYRKNQSLQCEVDRLLAMEKALKIWAVKWPIGTIGGKGEFEEILSGIKYHKHMPFNEYIKTLPKDAVSMARKELAKLKRDHKRTPKTKRTATQIICDVLLERRGEWLAVHEITAIARDLGEYISDNAAATRMTDELKGEVVGRIREGKRFKEWSIPKADPKWYNAMWP